MPTTPKPSVGGNLYVGPSLTASLLDLLGSLSAPAAPPEADPADA